MKTFWELREGIMNANNNGYNDSFKKDELSEATVTVDYGKASKSADTKHADPYDSSMKPKEHIKHHDNLMKKHGVSPAHAKAIRAHDQQTDWQKSNKKGFTHMSKHGGVTVHSRVDRDNEEGAGTKVTYHVS